MGVQVHAASRQGADRPHNEDSFLVCEDLGLVAVADGMGGHRAGEVASELCLAVLQRSVRAQLAERGRKAHRLSVEARTSVLRAALNESARAVFEASREASKRGMGTTIAVLWVPDDVALVAHVGDSRVYKLGREGFVALTVDHSLAEEVARQGFATADEVRRGALGAVLTRSLGRSPEAQADLSTHAARRGDRFLLATDGLTEQVDAVELAQNLRAAGADAVDALLAASDGAADDNTMMVVAADPAIGFRWWRAWRRSA